VNAIGDGDFPKWDFFIQTLDPADEMSLDFDPLDCTKVWPEEDFPLQPVGTLVLDRNIDNFHNESEQIAFNPAATIAGIGLSNDKVLQSRVLSYADTQRYRIGTNYQMLPINAPRCPFHNSHENGAMNFMEKTGEVNYWPSTQDNVQTSPDSKEAQTIDPSELQGHRVKMDIVPEEKQNDFKQAGDRYRGMSLRESGQFIFIMSNWMADPKCTSEIRDRWLNIWDQVDSGLGTALRAALAGQQPLQAIKEGRIGGDPSKMTASKA
jgi:catalase